MKQIRNADSWDSRVRSFVTGSCSGTNPSVVSTDRNWKDNEWAVCPVSEINNENAPCLVPRTRLEEEKLYDEVTRNTNRCYREGMSEVLLSRWTQLAAGAMPDR